MSADQADGAPVAVELDAALRARLEEIATDRKLGLGELLASAARELVVEDEDFRRAVAVGIADAQEGRLLDHDEVVAAARTRRRPIPVGS